MRRLFILLAIVMSFIAVATPAAEAHVIRPIYHDTCRYDWRANVENRVKVARCFATYFKLKPDRLEGMVWCESGFQLYTGGSFEGPYQYLWSTWNGIKGHYWPGWEASPYNMRQATVVTVRYIRHLFAEGRDGWGPWPHCGDYDVAMYHYNLHN